MRPGLTGLWQVSERNECSFAGRVRFDDIYHRDHVLRHRSADSGQTVMVVCAAPGTDRTTTIEAVLAASGGSSPI
jgi:exopolysaccharide production protein ExoY